jgi:protein-S-isoprenylcysteine O-methyltransferase Ste14
MNQSDVSFPIKSLLFALILFLWWLMLNTSFASGWNLSIIIGAILLVFPVVWLGRKMLDKQPTKSRADWITTFVHYSLMALFGSAVIRAIISHPDWAGWVLPVPEQVGRVLVILFSAACVLSVSNLALKGLGAPFAIALSQKLAMDWLYAWTRNPMVLASLALLVSVGIWFQSVLFVLWALILVSPALLFFVRVYEERELEIRFGASYMEYKSKTPMLFPRKPRD